jgi:hypothetical protein
VFSAKPAALACLVVKSPSCFHGGNTGSNPVGDANIHFSSRICSKMLNRLELHAAAMPLGRATGSPIAAGSKCALWSEPGQYGRVPPLCGLANTQSSSVGYGLCSRQFKTLDSRELSGTGLREAPLLQSPTCCTTIERMTWTSIF